MPAVAAVGDDQPCGVSARRSRVKMKARPDIVKDDIVAVPVPREVFAGVINDVICAQRPHQIRHCAVLHTPVTSAPSSLAICTANVPTPPEAPMIKNFLPGLDFADIAQDLEARSGRQTAQPRPASKVRLAGFSASLSSATQTYSA